MRSGMCLQGEGKHGASIRQLAPMHSSSRCCTQHLKPGHVNQLAAETQRHSMISQVSAPVGLSLLGRPPQLPLRFVCSRRWRGERDGSEVRQQGSGAGSSAWAGLHNFARREPRHRHGTAVHGPLASLRILCQTRLHAPAILIVLLRCTSSSHQTTHQAKGTPHKLQDAHLPS